MNKLTSVFIALNLAVIALAGYFYFNEWIPMQKTVNCIQMAAITANAPERTFMNFHACMED